MGRRREPRQVFANEPGSGRRVVDDERLELVGEPLAGRVLCSRDQRDRDDERRQERGAADIRGNGAGGFGNLESRERDVRVSVHRRGAPVLRRTPIVIPEISRRGVEAPAPVLRLRTR